MVPLYVWWDAIGAAFFGRIPAALWLQLYDGVAGEVSNPHHQLEK